MGLGTVQALASAIALDAALLGPDTRTLALEWVEEHAPAGSRLAREFSTPQVSPACYEVGVAGSLSEKPLDWYRSAGVDLLIASKLPLRSPPPGTRQGVVRPLFKLRVVFDEPGVAWTSPRIVIIDLRGASHTYWMGPRP